jgi:type VI secretion system secreted protein VgrG
MFAMPYTQENRLIRISTPLGGDELLITGFRGSEEISRLFHFELSLLSHNHSIDFKTIIGGNVTVSILLDNGEERFFNGLVASFSQSSGNVHGERRGAVFSQYTATIVPWLWLLTKTSDLRIFQDKSAVDIIKQIFTEKGLSDYTDKLTGTYVRRTYCVQYRETDFIFISRLMEEEGIAYYFSHENNKHTLVLADAPTAYTPCLHHENVRFQTNSMSGGRVALDEDMITTLELKNEIRVGKYSLNDYNFETPNTKMLVEVESRQNLGPGEKEIYDYPGLYTKRAEGDDLVKIRMEADEVRIAAINGSSDVRGFASGYSFTLEEYFRDEMNNKKYLLTAVKHSAGQQGFGSGGGGENSYANAFTCIPLDTPYRPARLTPKPVVEGVQTAVVVGPAGEEIYTDEHGRIKVQFHWDREGKANENSSCWVRVGQMWAGSGWGALYIPRIGQEVIVDFLEGDPDRPIVIGSVYHGNNRPPYPLPDEKTKSTIKSDSSKGGGGFNEIRFEDKKGSEEVYLQGEKDWNTLIKHDKNQKVGNNETLVVANNRTNTIGGSQSETIGANLSISVGGNKTETIGINSMETIGAAKELTIGGAYQVSVVGIMNETVGGVKSEEVGGSKVVLVGGDRTDSTGGKHTIKAEEILLEATKITIQAGGSSLVLDASGITAKGAIISLNP